MMDKGEAGRVGRGRGTDRKRGMLARYKGAVDRERGG